MNAAVSDPEYAAAKACAIETHAVPIDADGIEESAIEKPDVLVIGGGPAGTTAATLLARKGWRVTLLEKAKHPRFHIGESLLPMNLPILQRLGVLEQVRAIGVHKPGADCPLDATRYNSFHFRRAIDPKFEYSFQVKREEFDQLLFEHARSNGVDAREQVKVDSVEWDAAGRATVRATLLATAGAVGAHADVNQIFQPRYVVDASGRDTFLGNTLKLKSKNDVHQSAAIFSHFRGVQRQPGEDGGNITVQRFEHGWMWLIPLREDVMSVGAVCFPEYLRTRRGESETFLMRTLESEPMVWKRMQGAERVAPVHVTGNYSYTCKRMTGPGWVMVGDAFAFIDPVFSSGVYLGMNSAEHAAEVVDASLRDPSREAALQRAMEQRLRRGLRHFSWFIYRFTTPVMQHLFANPRNVWQIEQAVISMLAGDVFDSPAVLRRLRLFRMIYLITSIRMLPQALQGWLRRRRQVGVALAADETLQPGANRQSEA